MRAGQLNSRIALERKVETATGTGGSTIAWEHIADVWANIRYLNGVETVKSGFPVSTANASIRIRWREDIDATCRAVYGSGENATYFEILAVLPDATGREYVDLVVNRGESNG